MVERAVSEALRGDPALGEPARAGIHKIHHAADLTVLNVVWAPGMTNHAARSSDVGSDRHLQRREDNVFWRRIRDDEGGKIEEAGARTLADGDAIPLGRDIVHSVTNPLPRFTGALHVYGGDFFGIARSEWDPRTLREQPYDVEKALRLFEDANAAARNQ